MIKFDDIPYSEASKRQQKDLWMGTTWIVPTSFLEDSTLGRATKIYLQAVQDEVETVVIPINTH